MLVLTRHVNESVVITMPDGSRCLVSLVEIKGNKARIGFEFPEHISVHRSEIQDALDGIAPRNRRRPLKTQIREIKEAAR